jgi:hypothetical protein
MSEQVHIKSFRLFDLTQAHSLERGFQLNDWEKQHLETCEECRALAAFFTSQITAKLPSYMNGETNQKEGWYKTLCCGIELFVRSGQVFPDCRRHKTLPTQWKSCDTAIPHAPDLNKKKHSA